MKKILILFFILLIAVLPVVFAQDTICTVYITGVGCPNCAHTDPALLSEYALEYPDLIVIEYEIYHLQESNQDVANKYFETYIPIGRPGVPFLIFNKNQTALGRFEVLDSDEIIKKADSNKCPLANGSSIDFENLDIVNLPGKIKIWTKDRVLISDGNEADNQVLRDLLTAEDVSSVLKKIDFKEIEPELVEISDAKIGFENAIEIDGWILQWESEKRMKNGINEIIKPSWKAWYWLIILFAFLIVLFLIYKFLAWKKRVCYCFSEKQKNLFIVGIALILIIAFFILAKTISPDFLKQIGASLPLPIFTIFIALIDGFNPCNIFVLTVLLGLLISASHSRKKIYLIGYTFVVVVYIIYFLFMAAWLNIFKYIGFITPLRIIIAFIALGAGLINCKELFFFRKGITLMIQEKHKMPLLRKIQHMKTVILRGSTPALIGSSVVLAAFSSLVELPCTAGFPIIYTAILTAKVLESSFSYYLYLALYNLIYVVPLAVIIGIFGLTFKGKQISKHQMQIIKFIGGFIMILLGLILLFAPSILVGV